MPYSNKLQTANLLQVANNLQVTNSLEVTNELLAVSTLPAPATPTFAISDGTTHTIQTVTITADGGTTTYYTTDGSTPTPASTLYSGPFNITVAETIKAYSVEAGHFDSAVGTVVYAQVTTPTFSPVAGTYFSTQSVTIISAGASNFYYKIGGPPSYGDETTGASVSVASSETVYARACRAGYVNSAIGSAAYVITTNVFRVPMSDGSGTIATDIIAGDNLTITPGSGGWATQVGVANGVYNFDGTTTKMIAATNTNLNFNYNQPFSVFGVINQGTNPAGNIIGNADTTLASRGWQVIVTGTTILFALVNTVGSNNIITSLKATTPITPGTLYDFVIAYDGSATEAGVNFYVNGNFVPGNSVVYDNLSATTQTSTLPEVGMQSTGGQIYAGKIGPLGVWNRVLTQGEVTTLHGDFYAVIN
jgi:hypothetical protein